MTADARVCVNGVQVSNPAARVRQSDRVTVDGELTPLEVAPPRLWRFHKPDGLITTASDPQGRPTVFASLPGWLPRVLSVGRLDLRSEGLLLLTNSGPLARMLELPSNAFERKYRALVCTGQERGVTGAMLRAMGDGFGAARVRIRMLVSLLALERATYSTVFTRIPLHSLSSSPSSSRRALNTLHNTVLPP